MVIHHRESKFMKDFQPSPVCLALALIAKANLRRAALGMAVFGSLLTLSPVAPAIAVGFPAIPAKDSRDDYRRCVRQLVDLKLPQEDAIDACGRSLTPEYLATCTVRISRREYAPVDALNACRQVRRPEDLAHCVADIRGTLKTLEAADVLDNCRRSLLPIRYSDCVIGMSRVASAIAPTVLSKCIDTQYFPREVDPTFIPYSTTPTVQTVPEAPVPVVPAPTPVPAPAAPAAPVRGLY
jgi:hypothetical protein